MTEKIPDDGILVKNARLAVELELKKKRALGQPIARFDLKTKEVYLEYPDGSRTPMGSAEGEVRYSERHS